MGTFIIFLGVMLWVLLAFWPAIIAKRKGYSFILFLVLSWVVSFIVTLIIAALLRDKNETAEDREASIAADEVLAEEEDAA